jgi:hypothetical protein
VRLTRRQFVAGGAGALAAAGVYGLVDHHTESPERGPARVLPSEQHALGRLEIVMDNGVEVVVPPLHHEVVTAVLRVDETPAALRAAKEKLEEVLRRGDDRYGPAPAGLSISVGWGLPYFERYVPEAARDRLPVDLRASEAEGRPVLALVDAIRFPSDPQEVILEQNHVAFFFRSDVRDHISSVSTEIFDEVGDVLELTSIRRGFMGGGFHGGQSLPKRMALAAGVPGAELIPDTAELFLGFTSTQKAGLGPPGIANFETLPGYTDQWPDGYFLGGTAMHLSHIFEDIEAWYLNFDFSERVSTTFRPGLRIPEGTQTVPQDQDDADSTKAVHEEAKRFDAVGHSSDFNTLDNPFFWSGRADLDGQTDEPAAGLHFVVFTPTADDFHRTRLAMDGILPDGSSVPIDPRSRQQGFNSILRTTHRQNFLVPPRKHRAFPLVEFL